METPTPFRAAAPPSARTAASGPATSAWCSRPAPAGAPPRFAKSARGVRRRRGRRRPGATRAPPSRASETPALDYFGRDLTADAREGRIDPVIGRADEIEQTIEILARRARTTPC